MAWSMKVIEWVWITGNYELKNGRRMIFSIRARGCVKRVCFYKIPYIRERVVGIGSSNAGKHNFSCWKESYHVLDHFIGESCWTAVGWPIDGVSLLLIRRTSYCCTNSYLAICFMTLFVTIRMKYWIWESTGWGDESGNLHHMVGINWMLTSHV